MRPARTIIALIFLSPIMASGQPVERRMAVTMDDLPTVNVADDTDEGRLQVTRDLLSAFADLDIPVIGFVNETQLDDDSGMQIDSRVALLRMWLEAGFELGNHAYSHPDLHEIPLEAFKDDVLRGETVTRGLLEESGRSPRYFRHPYLHTGRSLEIKREFEGFLDDHGYRVAPVTIDNSEWIFARAYVLALRAGDDEMADRIGRDYVDYMLEMVAFYEDQSAQLFGRNISQVLLVHANKLNADWFGELGSRLRESGYAFISLDDALEDPAYRSADTYTGPGGITWIHRWAITREVDPAMFRGEPQSPEYVLELTRLPEHGYED
jgi:peptidoglycan/xylan/chitin deacetylase (PgdA/CDA1 family)